MRDRVPYSPILFLDPIEANKVGSLWLPTLYLEVQPDTLPFVYGAISYLLNPKNFIGTENEIRTAISTLQRQSTAQVYTQAEICGAESYGADFRIILTDLMQSLQGEGLPPPPWEFRLLPQQDGSVMVQFRTVQE